MASTSPAEQPKKPEKVSGAEKHRAETIRQIWLPLAGGGLILLAILIVSVLLPQRIQVQMVSDLLSTLFILCPMAVCILPIYVLMVALIFSMNKIHGVTSKPLQWLEKQSERMVEETVKVADVVAKKSIGLSTKMAYFERWLGFFNRPPQNSHKE